VVARADPVSLVNPGGELFIEVFATAYSNGPHRCTSAMNRS
jgi:hypothetical protein